jgi:hypothetical protein
MAALSKGVSMFGTIGLGPVEVLVLATLGALLLAGAVGVAVAVVLAVRDRPPPDEGSPGRRRGR